MPIIWPDEPVFTDVAKHIFQSYKVQTSLYGDIITGLKNGSIAYPPVYFIGLGLWLNFVGDGIEMVRWFSILMGIIDIGLFYLILKKITDSRGYALLGIWGMGLSFHFIQVGHIGRMEILVLGFGLAAVLAYITKTKFRMWLSGGLVGLSMLTHPMGVISALMVGWLILVEIISLKNKIRELAILGIVILSMVVFWWWWFVRDDWLILQTQLIHQLIRKGEIVGIFELLVPKNKLFSAWLGLYIAQAVLMMSYGFKCRKVKLFSWGVIELFVLAEVYNAKEMWYLVYLVPICWVSSILLIRKSIALGQWWAIWGMGLVGLNLFLNLSMLRKAYLYEGRENYFEYSQKISSLIDENSQVCLSAIPDPYFGLSKRSDLRFREFLYVSTLSNERLRLLDTCNYLVINFPIDDLAESYLKLNSQTNEELLFEGIPPTRVVHLKSFSERVKVFKE